MKSGSWHGSPFFLYLLLSFKCRNRRIRLKRSLFMIFLYTNNMVKLRSMYMYMYVYLFCLKVCEWTVFFTVSVGVRPLSCPMMFYLRVSNEPHDDAGKKI